MPFCPLPATFLDDLHARKAADVLELGCGDGRLTALLKAEGARPWTLDRAGPLSGARPHVRGDALRPPLRPGRFALVVAANLLRHLWPAVRAEGPLAWRQLLAPGGVLWILEDEPLLDPPAARHYARLQEWLARLDPQGRRPLLPQQRFVQRSRRWRWPGHWHCGQQENRWPLAHEQVLAWLAGGQPRSGGEIARLCDDIARDGLSCGHCWWARWTPEADT